MQKILLNQIGFLPEMQKSALFRGVDTGSEFQIVDLQNEKSVYTGTVGAKKYDHNAGETVCCGDFTELAAEGSYYITVMGERSHNFTISDNVYNDFITNAVRMMYMQRCGTELDKKYAGIFAHKLCHTDKAFI